MRIQIETLFTLDSAGRLLHTNDLTPSPAPRFFLGRTPRGNEWRFRHDLRDDIVTALDTLCASEPVGDEPNDPRSGARRYEAILARDTPVTRVWAGPAYRFPRDLPDAADTVFITSANRELLEPYCSAWLEDVATGNPFVALVNDGHAVSVCTSVRTSIAAHEAGVETHPAFRGRGHAARVVAAWARAVRTLGSIPLYSTSWENAASQAVARKLELERFGADLHVT